MALDAYKNFAYSTVATAPSPAASGTSLVLPAGDGAKFPAAPFNAVIWPVGVQPTSANAEIARVTAVATDTLTIVRSTSTESPAIGPRTVIVGDQIAANITNKLITDIAATYLPLIGGTVSGPVAFASYLTIKGPVPFVDVLASGFTRQCAASLATTTGSIPNGSATLTLASATGWQVGHGVAVIRSDNTVYRSYITVLVGAVATCFDTNTGLAITTQTVYHDDSLAIQDAITYAGSNGKVILPGGFYYIWNIQLAATVALEGAGVASTTLLAIPGNTSAIGMVSLTNGNNSNCGLRHLSLNGNKAATPAPTCGGLYVNNTGLSDRRHHFTGLRIINTAGDAISCTAMLKAHFTDVYIDSPNGHGVTTDSGCFFNTWANVEITSAGLNGVNLSGDGDNWTNLFAIGAGQVEFAVAGANIKINTNSHGHSFQGFWVGEGKRVNIDIDAGTGTAGGQTIMTGESHQNNSAGHVLLSSGTAANLRIATVDGTVKAATYILNVLANATRNFIHITYRSSTNVLLDNVPPAIGAGLTGNDNNITIVDGSKTGAGDINVFESEPLLWNSDTINVAPSTIYMYPGSIFYNLP